MIQTLFAPSREDRLQRVEFIVHDAGPVDVRLDGSTGRYYTRDEALRMYRALLRDGWKIRARQIGGL